MNRLCIYCLAVATLMLFTSCIGWGRNRSDEFDRRLSSTYDDYDDYDRDYDRDWDDDSWERPSPQVQETMVEHRPRPVVDPGGRSVSTDDGPLMYLNRLYASLAGKRVSGYALVWEDARVFRSADLDEDSSLGRLGYRPDHWRAGGGQAMPVRVIADHGSSVEIETLSVDEARRQCDGGVRGAMGAYQVRMFVARSELVPVTTKEFTREFSDGSVVTVPAGVAVRPTDQGLFVRLSRGAIEVPGPDSIEEIGLSYVETGLPEDRLGGEPIGGILSPSSPLRLAGEPVQLRMLPGEAGKPRWVRGDGPGGASRIFMADRCVAFILVTDDPEPMAEDTMGALGISGLASPASSGDYRYQVRQGATAFWAGGERAGVTREVARHSLQPENSGGLLCFSLMGVVNICHDEMDVSMNDRVEVRANVGVVEEEAGEWSEGLDDEEFEEVRSRRGRMMIFEDDDD